MIQLTDEEVWLRAYCAMLTAGRAARATEKAEMALQDFRHRFPNKASNKEDKT